MERHDVDAEDADHFAAGALRRQRGVGPGSPARGHLRRRHRDDSLNAVYDYEGTTWTLRTGLGTAPGARYGASVAFDVGRSRLVMTSGTNGTTLSDTWELGATWLQVTGAPLSPARYYAATAFHASLGKVVVAGGVISSGSLSGSSTYDGASWTSLASAPSARGWVTMTYDSARAKLVLFGGFNSPSYLADTWEY